jgi:hypothetical protein
VFQKKLTVCKAAFMAIVGLALVAAVAATQKPKAAAPWSFNATIIEACS